MAAPTAPSLKLSASTRPPSRPTSAACFAKPAPTTASSSRSAPSKSAPANGQSPCGPSSTRPVGAKRVCCPPKVYNPPYSCSPANDVSFCNSVQTWEKRVVGQAVRGQPATHFFWQHEPCG